MHMHAFVDTMGPAVFLFLSYCVPQQKDMEEMASERRQRIELAALVPPRVKKSGY